MAGWRAGCAGTAGATVMAWGIAIGLCAGGLAFVPDALRVLSPLWCAGGWSASRVEVTVTEDDDGTGYDFTLQCVDRGRLVDVPTGQLLVVLGLLTLAPAAALGAFVGFASTASGDRP